MFERNLENAKQRVTVVKPKEEAVPEAAAEASAAAKKPKVGRSVMQLGADIGGDAEAAPDRYFDWRAEPIFVQRVSTYILMHIFVSLHRLLPLSCIYLATRCTLNSVPH
jgi:hypothetical protein